MVAILTPDEGEFDVAPIAAGPELLSYLREEVEARIVVKEGRARALRLFRSPSSELSATTTIRLAGFQPTTQMSRRGRLVGHSGG